MAAMVSFASLEGTMLLRRQDNFPRAPTSADEGIEAMISAHNINHFYLGSVREEEDVALLLGNVQLIRKICASSDKDCNADCTFSVTPLYWYQPFTISHSYKGYVFPLVHILMTSKKQSLYKAVLSKVTDVAPCLQPSSIMMDFECALRNSFRETFQEADVRGCWFHFGQAVYRNILKLGLSDLFKSDLIVKKLFHHIMALPLLPSHNILEMYTTLKTSTLHVPLSEKKKLR